MNDIGFIFDFNGTLFIDSDKHETAWRSFAKTYFHRDITDEEFRENIHGWNTAKIFDFLSGGQPIADDIDKLAAQKEAEYRRLCLEDRNALHLTDGAVELLDELVRRDLPRTIATASRKDNVDFYIEQFQLSKWFDPDKIVCDDGTLQGKPNPDIYLKAAKMIGVAPARCIVFEDAISGIESAHRAGAGQIIAVATGDNQSSLKTVPGVDEVIETFKDFNLNKTDLKTL